MTRTIPVYELCVDWNRDGDYSDTGENVTTRTRAEPISHERGRDQIRALAPPMAGTGSLTLDNTSRDYSPENGASPLVGNVAPGCLVRGRCTYSAVTYPLFVGILSDVPQHPERGARSVGLEWLGTLSRLRGVTASTAVYTNIRTDQAITVLLDAAGWPAADRVLATGRTTFPYWWMDGDDCLDMLFKLFFSEGPGAALYEDAQGRIVFEDRYYRMLTTRSLVSQGTFRDSGAMPLFNNFAYDPGLKDVINVASYAATRRNLQPLAVVWSTTLAITVGAGQTLTLEAVSQSGDPFINAVTPVLGTDYTIASGSLASLTLARTSGMSVAIVITGGSTGATVSGLQLRAQSLTAEQFRMTNTIDASASIARHGRQSWDKPTWPEMDPNGAQDFCNAVVSMYQQPRATVSISINTNDDVMTPHVLQREISDRITVVEGQTALSADFYLERVNHMITKGGAKHVATFGLEKAGVAPNYGVWGSGQWGYAVWGY